MLSRTLGRMLGIVVLLTVVAAVPTCVWQRQRARNEIGAVSEQFVTAVSKLDLLALRDCVTAEDRAALPAYYACSAARKLELLNRHVRVKVDLKVVGIKMAGGTATATIRRDLVERGTRLGRPVDSHSSDLCTVTCAYDGEQWLVDMSSTLSDKRSPLAGSSLFRECLSK